MKTTLALVALCALMMMSIASACSCMMPGTPADEMANSDAVFQGRVVKIEMPVPNDGTGSATVTLDVSKVWKGQKSKTITVSTATNSAACGFICESPDCTAGFKEGGEYIVYAGDYNGDGALSTSICTRTKLLSEAQEDLEGLGEGTVMNARPLQGGEAYDMSYIILVVVIALVVVACIVYATKGAKSNKNIERKQK